jgi:hypothetical protein
MNTIPIPNTWLKAANLPADICPTEILVIQVGNLETHYSVCFRRVLGPYLRGGGLTYRITANWNIGVDFIDGTNGVDEKREIYRHLNGLIYLQPKPFTDLVTPAVG